MKNFVLVSFAIGPEQAPELIRILTNLGDDFIVLNSDVEFETSELGIIGKDIQLLLHGSISSESATMLKLTHPWVSELMQISYIPDDMKDRYRR